MQLLLFTFLLIQVISKFYWQPWTWDPYSSNPFFWFDPFLIVFILIIVIIPIIFIVVFVVVFYSICHASQGRQLDKISTRSTFDLTKLPKRTRRVLREQLPRVCPECDAPLKYSEVKWIGPHQAECPYCGHTVKLELIETTIYE